MLSNHFLQGQYSCSASLFSHFSFLNGNRKSSCVLTLFSTPHVCLLMATDPPADTVVFHIALLCCSTSSYLVKLPAPHSSPGTTTQKKKKVFCSHMSDYPVPVSAKRRHCLQRQSKAEKTFFHHHSPSLLSGAGVNAENKLVRSTCARLAALSWCHQGPHVRISQMPLRLKFFHF